MVMADWDFMAPLVSNSPWTAKRLEEPPRQATITSASFAVSMAWAIMASSL